MQELPIASENTPREYLLNPPEKRPIARPVGPPPEVEVPVQLRRPHRALRAIRAELKGCRADDFGRIGQSDGPMHVSKEANFRACRIFDACAPSAKMVPNDLIH